MSGLAHQLANYAADFLRQITPLKSEIKKPGRAAVFGETSALDIEEWQKTMPAPFRLSLHPAVAGGSRPPNRAAR
jgi:hypothetical protein